MPIHFCNENPCWVCADFYSPRPYPYEMVMAESRRQMTLWAGTIRRLAEYDGEGAGDDYRI